jgi:hypothetical protein
MMCVADVNREQAVKQHPARRYATQSRLPDVMMYVAIAGSVVQVVHVTALPSAAVHTLAYAYGQVRNIIENMPYPEGIVVRASMSEVCMLCPT